MKLINIHIPKTAGSSVNKFIFDALIPGFWLRNGELDLLTKSIWDADYISGHFTRSDLFSWIKREGVPYGETKLMTMIRHPLDQLQSNLSFPFELQRLSQEIQEPWMVDILRTDPQSSTELCNVINKHRWLLNIQWQFIVTDLSLEESLACFDHISIFPDTVTSMMYASSILTENDFPIFNYQENISLKKYFHKNIFSQNGIRELILNEHRLDMELYLCVIKEQLNIFHMPWAVQFIPDGVDELFERWLSD
jgi:hypothetical protein